MSHGGNSSTSSNAELRWDVSCTASPPTWLKHAVQHRPIARTGNTRASFLAAPDQRDSAVILTPFAGGSWGCAGGASCRAAPALRARRAPLARRQPTPVVAAGGAVA